MAALLLEVALLAMAAPLPEVTGDAIDCATANGTMSLTHTQLKAAIAAETHGRRLTILVEFWLVLACQCGIAFWIGRRSARRWYFGLSPALVQPLLLLLVFVIDIDSHVGRLARNMNLAPFVALCMLTLAIPLALAAWLGGHAGASTADTKLPVA